MERFKVLMEYFEFLRREGKWWMFPIVAILMVFGVLILATQGSPLAPFLYTLF